MTNIRVSAGMQAFHPSGHQAYMLAGLPADMTACWIVGRPAIRLASLPAGESAGRLAYMLAGLPACWQDSLLAVWPTCRLSSRLAPGRIFKIPPHVLRQVFFCFAGLAAETAAV
jgi:hypothetical protein